MVTNFYQLYQCGRLEVVDRVRINLTFFSKEAEERKTKLKEEDKNEN